ncbi:GNAT family N-acetyltransferase [Pseudoroseomonas cervicalis]|uniref:GNAT family N-acetyltransferase n=1 Tax=Teichococcus cervicalis TaxID=204525 RepID=UPI0022F15609|nr:GNAT family N-acetyltransferase [Pseudoroseomonas cervicalis]WBV42498.1 GNAT family N-acetyltransferase [Pseudoroseomonas cervicalis]
MTVLTAIPQAAMAEPVLILPAGPLHWPGMLAIFNEVVAHSTAVYTDVPQTLEQRAAWCAQRQAQGFPVLVALGADERDVLGFASFTEFRGCWPGFRHTVEHSVHIRADCRGRGLGTRLVAALVEQAVLLGKHVMVASIDAENAPSIRMHQRMGFRQVALMPQVGCKFGRWLDLVLMQKQLGDGPPPG